MCNIHNEQPTMNSSVVADYCRRVYFNWLTPALPITQHSVLTSAADICCNFAALRPLFSSWEQEVVRRPVDVAPGDINYWWTWQCWLNDFVGIFQPQKFCDSMSWSMQSQRTWRKLMPIMDSINSKNLNTVKYLIVNTQIFSCIQNDSNYFINKTEYSNIYSNTITDIYVVFSQQRECAQQHRM